VDFRQQFIHRYFHVGSVVGGIALFKNDDLGRFVMHVITLSDGGRNIAVRDEV